MTIATDIKENPVQDAQTLSALNRRTVALLCMVAPAILLTILLVISQQRKPLVGEWAKSVIPAMVTQDKRTWTSTDMKFTDFELDILETRDYVYRTYTDGKGAPVDLCVIFSEDNRKGTHPPDVCLEASGSRILTRNERAVNVEGKTITVRELVTLGAAGQHMYFAYFYMCGETFTPSFYKQQVQIILNGLMQQNASGALIRYSTPMAKATSVDDARARADELIAATFSSIRRLNSPH